METDITPIFKNDTREPEKVDVPPMPNFEEDNRPPTPNFKEPLDPDEEFTPINEVHEEPSYHSMMPPHQPHPYYWPQPPMHHTPTPETPQWDPFKNISTSTWVILVLAFALGFFIGKFK
jgi:hypothetical protein